jgi:NadR type nicotinamide-nucleotide adenylyltransferase
MTRGEVAANAFNAASIVLAGRNSVHTWWTGIVGCVIFGYVFFASRLYADTTLQLFFIVTSVVGWIAWAPSAAGEILPVRRSSPSLTLGLCAAGLAVTAGYAWLLHRFTDAFAPVPDSAVLAFSVLGQLLMMKRRLESWWCWLVVNTLAVPLYFSRGLYLTGALYVVFWVNAVISLRHWARLADAMPASVVKPHRRALVVGKFAPPHKGHELVIERAFEVADDVVIVSYTNPELAGCEPARRRRWLSALFPAATVLVWDGPDTPPNDASDTVHRRFVGRLCTDVLGLVVDAVLTSEDYGPGFARELGSHFGKPVTHVAVDPERARVPISASRIRRDVHAHRQWLSGVVYASFVQRVTFLGGESSGKSTLSRLLAERLETAAVEEYGRELWTEKGGALELSDMVAIAERQIELEERAAEHAHRYLFCDTSPLTTLLYSRDLFGTVEPRLEELARRAYDLTVLCAPDFDFVQDGTRRDDAFRRTQHQFYLDELAARGIEFVLAEGSIEARLARVVHALSGTR